MRVVLSSAILRLLLLGLLLMMSMACATLRSVGTPAPTPPESYTPPTAVPSISPIPPTPSATATLAPSATPSISPSPSITPSRTPRLSEQDERATAEGTASPLEGFLTPAPPNDP